MGRIRILPEASRKSAKGNAKSQAFAKILKKVVFLVSTFLFPFVVYM